MKTSLIILSLITGLYGNSFNINSVENISSSYSGVVSKKDLSGSFNIMKKFDKTTIFEGWSENIVQNSTFDGKDKWNEVEGNAFRAEVNNDKNRDDNPFMFGKSVLLQNSDFTIEQDIYSKKMPYMEYILFNFLYTGKEKKDTVQVLLDVLDGEENILQTIKTKKIKGKNYKWKYWNQIKTMSVSRSDAVKIEKFRVRIKEDNKKGLDADAFLDNVSIKMLRNFFYADNNSHISEKIIFPNVLKKIKVIGGKGYNYFIPDRFEKLSKYTSLYGADDKNYIILPFGIDNRANGGNKEDVLIGYQGNKISDTELLYSYKGEDKLYLPAYGTGHYAVGGNGWDTVVFKGKKEDYTIEFNASGEHDDYDISSSNMSARVYECEEICFTTKNVLNSENGNIPDKDMDCYIFKDDGTTDIVNSSLPNIVDSKKVKDYVLSKRIQLNKFTISSSVKNTTEDIDIYLTNIPKYVKNIIYNDGTVVDINHYTNGDNEDKYDVKLSVKANGDTTFKFNVEDYSNEDDTTPIDLSSIVITRALK